MYTLTHIMKWNQNWNHNLSQTLGVTFEFRAGTPVTRLRRAPHLHMIFSRVTFGDLWEAIFSISYHLIDMSVCVELASRLQCLWPDEWGTCVVWVAVMGHFDHFWVISTRFGLIIPFLKIGSPNIGGTLVEEITWQKIGDGCSGQGRVIGTVRVSPKKGVEPRQRTVIGSQRGCMYPLKLGS